MENWKMFGKSCPSSPRSLPQVISLSLSWDPQKISGSGFMVAQRPHPTPPAPPLPFLPLPHCHTPLALCLPACPHDPHTHTHPAFTFALCPGDRIRTGHLPPFLRPLRERGLPPAWQGRKKGEEGREEEEGEKRREEREE